MSEIKVNSIKGVGASSAAITVNNTDGTCTANITNNLSNRNLIINGAMQVAQRGTSSTEIGKKTIDMFQTAQSTTNETPQQAQADVASGTTPYTLGFRKSFKVTNGNQTSGAQTGSIIAINYRFEAQDIANSGWNYTSSSSYVTLSFWVKSSVAQNFFGYLKTTDGTAYGYPFETGSLSADTWTKITKTIAGNSNLQFDNDANEGLRLVWNGFLGTDRTASSATLNQWGVYSGSARTPDNTSTWYTTNDATLEITGVQLEVGSVATDFEHKSFAQELALCQRYYYLHCNGDGKAISTGSIYTDNYVFNEVSFPVSMRANPSLDQVTGSNYYAHYSNGTADAFNQFVQINDPHLNGCMVSSNNAGGVANMSAGNAVHTITSNSASFLAFSAEL